MYDLLARSSASHFGIVRLGALEETATLNGRRTELSADSINGLVQSGLSLTLFAIKELSLHRTPGGQPGCSHAQ